MTGVFGLTAPGELLAKLSRELNRLRTAPNDVDHAFNFFVTAEHIFDWLIANPNFDDAALSHQIESWLGRLDLLMLRLAEEIPGASEEKARQLRGALGYFYLVAGELRGAFWDKAALTSVAQRSSERLGLCNSELGQAMAPEMIVGIGVVTTSAAGSTRAEGSVTPPPRGHR